MQNATEEKQTKAAKKNAVVVQSADDVMAGANISFE